MTDEEIIEKLEMMSWTFCNEEICEVSEDDVPDASLRHKLAVVKLAIQDFEDSAVALCNEYGVEFYQ